MARSYNIIDGAMRKHQLVFFFLSIIIVFGFLALPRLKKNEFPDVTIRTGVVAVVYPGATSEEIEQQVAGKVEKYLFTFSDVDKSKTYSYSKDGILYVFANLVPTVKDAPLTWSRIREGLQLFRVTDLPQGVLATAVIDDFGNASSLLLAIESDERSSRELRAYAEQLSDHLRMIPQMGNIKITGEQREEIAVHIDPVKMSQYAISPSFISAELAAHGFRTISGQVDNDESRALVHVTVPYDCVYDLQEMIIFSDPITGQSIRLGDVATLERRYEELTKYVTYSDAETGHRDVHCLILSMEMRPGNNIVAFGEQVEKQMQAFLSETPPDVHVHRITDQPKNVNRSVLSFMKDLIEAVLVVILVMLLLFPLRTALVSSTSVPVCIAATFGIMYLCGIELNTVTLAALIVVLGMIVDDSVVVIDGYSDMLHEGHSRWYSAAVSTKALMGSMLISTCSISGMFFPMIPVMKGSPLGDFIKLFPWAIFITLSCSFLYAIWVIPYMSSRMIRRTVATKQSWIEKIQTRFFGWLQEGYGRLLRFCFRHKWGTVITAGAFTMLGAFLFTRLNIQLLPKAERDSFAVEIHVCASSDVDETAAVADSLRHLLELDPRVTSVTSFIGQASPRFHITYAPQLADDSYAQFIVNTISEVATKEIFSEYPQRFDNYFPEAQIRFKQMDYQAIAAPVEIYIKGNDYAAMETIKDSVMRFMKLNPNLFYVHSDFDESTEIVDVVLDTEESNRLGISQSTLSVYLSGALSGSHLSTIWEGDYDVPISVYTDGVRNLSLQEIGDVLVPCAEPGMWVPLRQIASIVPRFHHDNMPHRNGVRCITVSGDVVPGAGQLREYKKVAAYLEELEQSGRMPEGVYWEAGGIKALTDANLPPTAMSVLAAVLVMFLVLVIHYGEIGISVLAISQSLICLFGACFGLWMFGLDFSVTAILGLISLVGIVVRNGIIMYDYAGELREKHHMSAHEAAYEAGLRRMRPIFLTSATTALGVVPMILAKTLLWEPMGVVICFGTLLTLPLVITLLPVTYCLVFDRGERRDERLKKLDHGFQKSIEAHEERIENYNKKHMGKTSLILIPLFLLLSVGLAAQPASPSSEGDGGCPILTLDSCLTLARQNNCTIRTARLDIDKAEAVKRQMLTKFFPQVSGSFTSYHALRHLAGVQPVDEFSEEMINQMLTAEDGTTIGKELGLGHYGLSVAATAVQPIFAGGRIVNANRYAKVGVEAAELKAEVTERDVLEQVQSSYLLVQGLQEKVATVDAALALLDSLDRVVEAGKRAGVLEPTDALRLELKRNEIRAKQLQLTNGIRLASRLLCLQVGIDCPESGLVLEPVEDIAVREPVARPEYRLLELNVQSEQFKKKLTIGETLPTIAFGGAYFYGDLITNGTAMKVLIGRYTQYRDNGLLFVTAKIPLTDWWETSYRIRQHNISIEQARMQQDDLTRMMQLQEDKARAEMLEAEALMRSDSAALNMARENYRLAEVNYRAGFETLTNVLEANALLLQAENALTDRRISYLAAKRRLTDLAH